MRSGYRRLRRSIQRQSPTAATLTWQQFQSCPKGARGRMIPAVVAWPAEQGAGSRTRSIARSINWAAAVAGAGRPWRLSVAVPSQQSSGRASTRQASVRLKARSWSGAWASRRETCALRSLGLSRRCISRGKRLRPS